MTSSSRASGYPRNCHYGNGRIGWKLPLISGLIGIVELFDLDTAFIEIVKQARIDAHLAEVLPKRLPVGSAAAD